MIRPLLTDAEFAEALAAPRAVIYKHSPRCGVCVSSQQEVTFFAEGHPDVPVFQLDVVARRDASQTIARELGVRHESPQVILLVDGRAVWSASHWDIRAVDLEERFGRRTPA